MRPPLRLRPRILGTAHHGSLRRRLRPGLRCPDHRGPSFGLRLRKLAPALDDGSVAARAAGYYLLPTLLPGPASGGNSRTAVRSACFTGDSPPRRNAGISGSPGNDPVLLIDFTQPVRPGSDAARRITPLHVIELGPTLRAPDLCVAALVSRQLLPPRTMAIAV